MSTIAASARAFNDAGRAMASATHSLASSCRVENEELVFGTELTSILHTLASVLDEVADSQASLCDSLAVSLASSLETFAHVEKREADRLVKKAEDDTNEYDTALGRYLHGRAGENDTSWAAPSGEGLGKSLTGFLSKSKGGSQSDKDKITTASTKCSLEQLRLQQVSAELARFKYLRRMESLKERRTFELGETMLASLHGIRAYFHHASDLTSGLNPRLTKLQERQSVCRSDFEKQQEPWNKREVNLKNKIGEIEAANVVSRKVMEAVVTGGMDMIGETLILEGDKGEGMKKVEEEVGVWKIQDSLSTSSLYERNVSKGVLYEGWLYKKSSSRMHLQTWNKRWFVLDKDGLHYLRGGVLKSHAHGIGMHANDQLERVKVCDILLCTVREARGGAERFVFDIISPNNRPYTLQARGPVEYDKWVNGIRRGIEKQLIRSTTADVRDTDFSRDATTEESISSASAGANEAETFVQKARRTMSIGPAPPPPPRLTQAESSLDGAERAVTDVLGSVVPQWNPDRSGGMSPGSGQLEGRKERAVSNGIANDVETGANSKNAALIKEIMRKNNTCCECGASSPTWLSMNLGVLFCLECSGIHRGLGVGVSKVRSLMLDELSEPQIQLLLRLGNKEMNRIWESGGQVGWVKPVEEDDRAKKEAWIKSKYLYRGFIDLDWDWPGPLKDVLQEAGGGGGEGGEGGDGGLDLIREGSERSGDSSSGGGSTVVRESRVGSITPPKPTHKAPAPPKELEGMKKQKSMKESKAEREAREKKLFDDMCGYVKRDDVLGVAYCIAHNVSINGDKNESEGSGEEGSFLDEGDLRPMQIAMQSNAVVAAELLCLNGGK
jgi:hypothetical protein